MTTRSPFLDNPLGDHDEAAQVGMAQAGDQESLESLVRRHSPWIAHPRSRRRLTSSPGRSLLAVMVFIVVVGACQAAPASSADILALERAAAERWGQGDPDGYLGLMAPDITYFDPVSGKRSMASTR